MDEEEMENGASADDTDSDSVEMAEEEEEEEEKDSQEGVKNKAKQVYLPGGALQEGEELVHDSSTYRMYHVAQTGAPCLSFDVLRDSLGENRDVYPMTSYLVAGTQTEKKKQNFVIFIKMSQLHQTQQEEDDDEDSGDEEEENKPQLDTVMIQHHGAINRTRATTVGDKSVVATWSDVGVVNIWDATRHVIMLDAPSTGKRGGALGKKVEGHKQSPLCSFDGHKCEGFAMDWSPTVPGRLATGDCHRNIHVWNVETGQTSLKWLVDKRPFTGHTDSVEDLQWSPNEQSVFSSCSVDRTIRIWDCRAAPDKANMLTCHAHQSDVNVISWNKKDPFLLSGGDDGIIKVWDLRQFNKGEAVAVFKHHTHPITSVEWHPADSTVFASAGEDDQVVQWDLSVEPDTLTAGKAGASEGHKLQVPPQLLFIHQGQSEVKEIHWHPQLTGVMFTTALTGFNVFRTISV